MLFRSTLRPALRLAIRARFLSFSLWLAIALAVAVPLAANFSGRQPATVGLDVGLSLIRLALPVLTVLLLQELICREFDRKLFLLSLTYPRARHSFLFGRVAAIGLLLAGLLVILAILLAGLVAWIGHDYAQATPPALGLPYVVTIAFIALDLVAGLALGTLLAVVASTPAFVLIGTLGFMLMARSFSAMVALLEQDTTLVSHAEAYQSSLSMLGLVLPDLGALDVRMVALYGHWSLMPANWAQSAFATLAYAAALLGLAVWALNRKRLA